MQSENSSVVCLIFQAGSWILVICLGVKILVCGFRVKEHYTVILKDENDDLIDIDLDPDVSYEILSPQSEGSPFSAAADSDSVVNRRKKATVKDPTSKFSFMSTGSFEETEDDFDGPGYNPTEPQEEPDKVDTLIQGISEDLVGNLDTDLVLSARTQEDEQVGRRRISKMASISEEQEDNQL